MKIRAQLTVEIETEDYLGAADFQRGMNAQLERVRETYPAATLDIRECRVRTETRRRGANGADDPGQRGFGTGMVHAYTDC